MNNQQESGATSLKTEQSLKSECPDRRALRDVCDQSEESLAQKSFPEIIDPYNHHNSMIVQVLILNKITFPNLVNASTISSPFTFAPSSLEILPKHYG